MSGKRLLLGRIVAAHGVRGEVVVHSFAAEPADIATYGALSDKAGTRAFVLKVIRVTPKGVVARIKDIADRNAAEALKGTELYVDRAKLPMAADNEFYHSDLIGLTAVTPEDRVIGKIVAVPNYGAGDLIEIALTATSKTELVPFTDAFVPQIDLAAGRVVVRMPVPDDDDGPPPNEIE